MTTQSVSDIANKILAEMGGNAEEICTGNCTQFAMRLIDQVGRGQIVSNLSDEMMDEIDGYEIIEPEAYIQRPSARNMFSTSHCWVKIDGRFYDAFDTYGVDDENYLTFIEKNG